MQTKTFKLEYTDTDLSGADVGVIVVAAGSASRMGGINKILAPLKGLSVIHRTVAAFDRVSRVKSTVIVTREDMIPDLQRVVESAAFTTVTDIVSGGSCRQESVKKGFERLAKDPEIKTVLVHDGARPLVSVEVIERVIAAAEEFSAAIPAVPVKDTIKKAGLLDKVEQTVEREGLVNIQTPQGFATSVLKTAFEGAKDLAAFTDDASLAESAGFGVYTVMGDYKNIKITTPEDIAVATALLSLDEEEK